MESGYFSGGLMMTTQRFEERLLGELQAVIATDVARARPRLRGQTRLSLAGALVAAATFAYFLFGGGGAAPAFAVESNADGSVTVTINRFSDAAGLEKALADAGVPAVVDYTPEGKMCRQPRGEFAEPNGPSTSSVQVADDGATTFTLSPGEVGEGQTLVLETTGGQTAQSSSGLRLSVIQGSVSPCELIDAPPVPTQSGGGDPGPSFHTENGEGQGFSSSGA
jgi:hypothetical protein